MRYLHLQLKSESSVSSSKLLSLYDISVTDFAQLLSKRGLIICHVVVEALYRRNWYFYLFSGFKMMVIALSMYEKAFFVNSTLSSAMIF